MTTISATLSTSRLPEITFLSPETVSRRLRFSLYRRLNFELKRNAVSQRWRILAAKTEEGAVLVDEKEDEYLTQLNGSSNGNYSFNGSTVDEVGNGSVGVVEKGETVNGSFAKYVNGNGNGAVGSSGGKLMELKVEREKKKKSIEEIGHEDAWFKQSGGEKVEVSVAPGGRWSRFKTYSTIQRTLEIWGSVLTFIFRVWLNNQKFSYRGQFFSKAYFGD